MPVRKMLALSNLIHSEVKSNWTKTTKNKNIFHQRAISKGSDEYRVRPRE